MASRVKMAPSRRRRLRLLKRIVLLGLFAAAAAAGSAAALWVYQSTDVPDVRALAGHTPSIITRIYASDGSVIGEFAQERRIVIDYKDMPVTLRAAVVAVDDADCLKPSGINFRGIARAAVINFKAGKVVEGGSSLTQQLAKLMF